MDRAEVEIVADMLSEVLAEREEDRLSVMAEVGSSVDARSIASEEESDAEKEDATADKENNSDEE